MSKALLNGSAQPGRIRQSFVSPPELPFLELRTTLNSSIPYASHFHSSLSLGLILQGHTTFSCPEAVHEASTGDIVLIEPELPHSCNPLDGRERSYQMLYLEANWCRTLCGLPQDAPLGLRHRVISGSPLFFKLRQLLEGILDGLGGTAQLAELIAVVGEILCPEVIPAHSYSAKAVLSRQNKLGREGFIRAFRRATGITPGSYAQLRRLEKARELLRGGAGIADTALACGFTDQSHFHRTFVRYFAATPRQYKARHHS